jgi:hypothetical protein
MNNKLERYKCMRDAILKNLPNDYDKTFLEVVPAEANLSQITDEFLLWLLSDPEHGVLRHSSIITRAAIETVITLYKRKLAKDRVSKEEWAEAAEDAIVAAHAAMAMDAAGGAAYYTAVTAIANAHASHIVRLNAVARMVFVASAAAGAAVYAVLAAIAAIATASNTHIPYEDLPSVPPPNTYYNEPPLSPYFYAEANVPGYTAYAASAAAVPTCYNTAAEDKKRAYAVQAEKLTELLKDTRICLTN